MSVNHKGSVHIKADTFDGKKTDVRKKIGKIGSKKESKVRNGKKQRKT